MNANLMARAFLGGAVVLLLAAVVFKVADLRSGWFFMPVSWWRASMSLGVLSIASSLLDRNGR